MFGFPAWTLAFAALIVGAASTEAQAQSQTTLIPGVVVEGLPRAPNNGARVLRLPQDSASSCAFAPGRDDYAIGFIASMRPPGSRISKSGLVGPANSEEAGLGASAFYDEDGLFSISSPLQDASRDGHVPTVFNQQDAPGACRDADYNTAAARAFIARADANLPEGLSLYDAGRPAEALPYFLKAYKKLPDQDGGALAALMAGKIYLEAPAPTGDPGTGLMWLRRAATAPIRDPHRIPFDPARPYAHLTPQAEAALLLGRLYLTGQGAPQNPAEARKWFERAEAAGFIPAAKTLGDLAYYGAEGQPDLAKAAKLYKRAAEYGFAPAQHALADMLYRGEGAERPDLKTAVAWQAQAAKQKHPGALYALALAYDTGEGVAADPQRALAYYRDAALAGSPAAQCAMGVYFYEGKLVPKDESTARKWFETAARGGDPDGMFNLAVMLMKGEGGEVDKVRAWAWFKLADRLKRQNADAALRLLETRMTSEEKQAAAELVAPRAS